VWLKGDFHAHSSLSDGVLPPRRFIDEAERERLDFFAITDHNTWSYPHFAESDQVLVIAGIEVTLPYGHFNVFSTNGVEPAWVSGLGDPTFVERGEEQHGRAAALVELVAREGLRASINHPLLFPWEWTDPEVPLAGFRYLEVWNDPTWPENRLANPAALDMWTRWLSAGLRITAVGGSDFHDPDKTVRPDGVTVDGHRVGIPRTYVDAESCTSAAILDAVDRGRAYVTMGPTIEFTVETSRGPARSGDRIDAQPVDVVAQTHGPGELQIRVVHDGSVVATAAGRSPGLEHHIEPEGTTGWIRVDVADPDGVIAFTNPVFLGPDPRPSGFEYGSFTDVSSALEIQERWQSEYRDNDQEEDPPWRRNA
jgi:hypothetical protein